jgi:tricorn protease
MGSFCVKAILPAVAAVLAIGTTAPEWARDGKNVLVRANRLPWGVHMGRHYLVPADGGDESAMEIPEGGAGMFSPDGKKIVYTPSDRRFQP